jgi:formate/nitrite transporter
MSSNFLTPSETAQAAVSTGAAKTKMSVGQLLVLGFLGGGFIALGALLDIRITAGMPPSAGTLTSFVGAAVFPVGLMLVVMAGAELLTGNMGTIPIALFSGKANISGLIKNWFWVLVGNFIGSLFVAYFFGVVAHVLIADPWKTQTIAIAVSKAKLPFGATVASAIGCNWLVVLAVWLAYASKDIISKIFAIWFPVMAFVAIGFQHVVANMFFIPAGMMLGAPITAGQLIKELVGAFIGNTIGGALFVAMAYWFVYLRKPAAEPVSITKKTAM